MKSLFGLEKVLKELKNEFRHNISILYSSKDSMDNALLQLSFD